MNKANMKKVIKQNVGMIFDENSEPIAMYWKNGHIRYFTLTEMNETQTDELWEADSPQI